MATPTVMASEAGTTPDSRRFSRYRRIRRRSEFQQVFERGTRLQSRHFTLLLLPAEGSASRLGIVASRKLGGAVVRNRAKRLIREMFRQLPAALSRTVDAVVIPRRELLDIPFDILTQEFRTTWRRGLDRVGRARS